MCDSQCGATYKVSTSNVINLFKPFVMSEPNALKLLEAVSLGRSPSFSTDIELKRWQPRFFKLFLLFWQKDFFWAKRAQVETLIFVLDFFLICSVMKKNLWKKFFKSFRALQSFVSLMAALTFDRKIFAFANFVK